MDRVVVDETRVLSWILEGQQVLQHLLPAMLDERDVLRSQLQDANRRCEALQHELDAVRAEIGRLADAHRRAQEGHAAVAQSVRQFLAHVTQALEPMRELTEKGGHARAERAAS